MPVAKGLSAVSVLAAMMLAGCSREPDPSRWPVSDSRVMTITNYRSEPAHALLQCGIAAQV
jgi:hypothetical protein